MRGARERLSPILMTALATGLALVPLAVAGDDPRPRDRAPDGDRHPRRPGHLDVANLFLVPSLYLRFGVREEA